VYKKILLPHQGLFLQAPFLFPEKRWFILVAGYGAGKTSSIADLVLSLCKQLQGKKDREGHRPRIILGGVTLAHLEKTTLAYIKEDLTLSNSKFMHDKKNNILHVGGVDVLITPLNNPEVIAGYDVCASVLDEVDDLGSVSNADDVTFNAIRAVNERTRQVVSGFRLPFIAMGSTSQGQKGLYRVYTQFKKANVGFVLMRGRTADNRYLNRDYVRALYQVYNERERRVYLEGEFLSLSAGRVLGDFDWDRNFMDVDLDLQTLSGETVYWSQDFNQGYHRGGAYILRSGVVYCVKRYEFSEIREAPLVVRTDFPHAKIVFVPDATAKEQVRHFTRELRRHDIHWVYRSKNPHVEDSAFLVNKLLYTKRLIFTRMAQEAAGAAARALRDKNNQIPKGIGPDSPIHDVDHIRIVCYYLAANKKELLDIRRVTIARHQEMFGDEVGVEEQAGGYSVIAPHALIG
jgi:hypothetical protein